MSYTRRFLQDQYIHNANTREVCALIDFLRNNDAMANDVYYKDESGHMTTLIASEAIRFFSGVDSGSRFRVDIDSGHLRVDKFNNNTSEANSTLAKLLRDVNNDSEIEYAKLRAFVNRYAEHTSECNNNSNEEDTNMSKLFPELKFGKVSDNNVKMSHLGIAVKNREGVYVAYDKTAKAITNVDIASVNGNSFLYQMPAQTSDIKVGDCILHNNAYFYIVNSTPLGGTLRGINYYDGTEDTIRFTTNMFGFNFVTKIVSVLDMMPNGSNMNNMMLPLLMLDKDSNGSDDTLKAMLMMQMMQPQANGVQQTQTGMNNMFSNPMMLLALAGDNNSDMTSLLMMSMMSQQVTTGQVTDQTE